MKASIVIVAGGKGLRMGGEIPKQFMLLNGKPVLMHTLEAFKNAISDINIILVLPKSQIEYWEGLCSEYNFKLQHTIVEGGLERFHSVKNGLEKVEPNELVGIHDGVRPLVSESTIQRTYEKAAKSGNAIPVIPIVDSIRQIKNGENKTVDRNQFFRIQTPQVFQSTIILKAFEQEYTKEFTDDASVLENTGAQIHLVEGNEENIKITKPFDLKVAELLIGKS